MKLATLTIIHRMRDGSHTARHVRGINADNWDAAILAARDAVVAQHRDHGPVIAAELSVVNPDPLGATLSKVYQPAEWS